MNAPGDSLEFSEGPVFKRMERLVPGLADAIRAQYAERPHSLLAVDEFLRKGRIELDGQPYEFLLGRRGPTKVYLFTVVPVREGRGIPDEDIRRYVGVLKR